MKNKRKKISNICVVLLLSFSLMLPNISFFCNDFAYASNETYVDRVSILNGPDSIELSTTEEGAQTVVVSDSVIPKINVYPTESGKGTQYACKLWYSDGDTWKTETMWSNKKLNGGSGINYAQFDFIGARAKYVAVGKIHRFKIEVNTKATSGENVETYYFNLIRSVGLSGVTATGDDAQALVVKKQADNNYVIACPYDTLNLTCTAKTPTYAQITVNDEAVESGAAYAVDLTKCEQNTTNGQKEISVKVAYTGNNGTGQGTEYKLLVESKDYTPNVKTSYTGAEPTNEDVGFHNAEKKISCDKKSTVTMEVEATAPEGSSLTYQWYLCSATSGDNTVKIIGDATNSTYTVPTEYVSETVYYCIVTNTVNDCTFTAESERCMVSVKPTYASPAVIVSQPNVVEVLCGQPKEKTKIEASSEDWGAVLIYQWYRTDKNESRNGQAITDGNEASVAIDATVAGEYYYYCEVQSSVRKEDGTTSVSTAVVSTPIKIVIKDTSSYFEGKGTEAEPFLIKTADDFEKIRTLVAGGNSLEETYFKMDCESKKITLPGNWEMIGTLKEGFSETSNGVGVIPFSGHLDGNGCTIEIPSGGKPLFRYVRDASISNLKIYGEKIDGAGLVDEYFIDYGEDGDYSTGVPDAVTIDEVVLLSGSSTKKSGFIHGNASGKNKILITDSTIEDEVVVGYEKSERAIGSFVGCLNGEIINCKSAAKVYGVSSVGGIAGEKGQSMGLCSVLNCQFTGEIHATGDYAGGMIGSGYDGDGTAPNTPVVSIQNCVVSGIIEGNNKIGGILGGEPGCENCWANGAGSVINNVFCGTITASDTDAIIGAIVGFMKSYNANQAVGSNYFTNSCGANNGVGSVEIIHDSEFDITNTGTAVSEQAMKDGTVVNSLNKSESSFKNWVQGTYYPIHSEKAVLYAIDLDGAYKTEYKTGDSFSTEGMTVIGRLSDGSKQEIDLSDVKFTGYNLNQRGVQTVTVTYGVAKATYEIRVLYKESQVKEVVAYFTLLGDSKHDEPTNEGGPHTLSSGNLKTWVARTKVTINNNTSVFDVFESVLTQNKIGWNGSDANQYSTMYISGVQIPDSQTYLEEFTNGPNSGWMYTLNGKHPNLGVAQQFLNNGDEIVFHYTDDWTKESDTSGWSGTTEEVKKVTTDTKTGTVTTPTETKVTEKTNADGTKEKTVAVTVSTANQTEIIKQATDKKSTEIVLEVASTQAAGAQNVQLQLNVSFVKNISDKTDAALTVNTENGTVSLDQNTIKTVLDEAKGTTITLDVNKVAKPTEVQKKAAGESGQILSLTVKSGDKTISDFKTGKVTVTVAISAALQNKRVAAIHIAEDGKIEQMPGKSRDVNGKKCYEFTTSHFSDFALVDADELGLETEDEIDAAALVAKLTPVARSAKTAKGYIKVQANLNKNDKAIISQLQDAGYTVKYRFYRSTKKSASYKSALTKETTSYTNTSGKKGTKYYYKVQVRVYDGSGKIVAKTALKQCKYACRTWK